MKKISKFQKTTICTILIACMFSSCKKYLQVGAPGTLAEQSRIFADDQTATAAVVGLYYNMVSSSLSFCNGGITLYTGLSGDEFANVNPSPSHEAFRFNSILVDNSTISSTFWSNPYKNIYQANAVIDGLNSSKTLTPSLKNQLQGEMLYIRALHYFYLVNLFGDVPLETTTDFQKNSIMPRTSKDEVYQQIISDLEKARTLLTNSYATSVSTRPNKGAATALLAKVYLYQNRWVDAEAMATDVISSGKYSLEPLNSAFLASSKEVIFGISKVTGNTAEGAQFIPASTTVKPTFTVTSNLLAAFEPGDNRKTAWLKSNTLSGVAYYYLNKYKARTSSPITENYIVQRLAELYLIRAEARVKQNNLSGALDDVDVIRNRAGLTKTGNANPGINQDDLFKAIQKERQVELFAEWGNRWFDLKRTGKADDVLGLSKSPNWQITDQLYPIPFAEIQKNPYLIQNDGYTN
ncbi:RagB/SusD family nutrient uptake outer membrane protein [Pedobacter sp. GR22-10]|uniref:RagB/SusD family nutrient uptake outer membrane protein n=1 Tax=Pedobacter sp. GR22-10 TaxID=2994472 RepID=UPI0022472393|nr:RagB/SusD family nutrient uptake outer membrane protein [Pedobacter sp. GR22-10]MCX2429900.1 RagB/SusD family nutrient uptake outer membrane protein [Pedobacter sp. GR22-10]